MSDSDDDSDDDGLFGRKTTTLEVSWSDDDDANGDVRSPGKKKSTPLRHALEMSSGKDSSDDDDDGAARAFRARIGITMTANEDQSRSGTPSSAKRREQKRLAADARFAEATASTRSKKNKGDDVGVGSSDATLEGVQALLKDADALAARPSPSYVPRAAEALAVDDSDDEDVREVAIGDVDDNRVDVIDGDLGEETLPMINLSFQLPNGDKFERRVGQTWTFAKIVDVWRECAEWCELTCLLGSEQLTMMCDGDVVKGDETPETYGLEDGDMLDVVKPRR
jgi:hypothetical protein